MRQQMQEPTDRLAEEQITRPSHRRIAALGKRKEQMHYMKIFAPIALLEFKTTTTRARAFNNHKVTEKRY